MQKSKNKQDTLAAINALVEIAYDQGFADGHGVGNQVGFVAGVMSLKAALACGLRHGSPKCGKALESLKRIRIDERKYGSCLIAHDPYSGHFPA